MPMSEASGLPAFLDRAARRIAWVADAEGAAAGLGAAVIVAAAGWSGHESAVWTGVAGLCLLVAGVVFRRAWTIVRTGRAPSAAASVEARAPSCRNLLITASELLEHPSRVPPAIAELVSRKAAGLIESLDLDRLFPVRRANAALGATSVLWVAALVVIAGHPPATPGAVAVPAGSAAITRIDVTVTPPAYTGRPPNSSSDPARVEALAGSRIHLAVRTTASTVSMETLGGSQALERGAPGTFTGDVLADADGYIAVDPTGPDGRSAGRRLIGLSVTADEPPRVRVTAPGRDLSVLNGNRTIDLVADATDDIGLASLRLRYTKVSGAGEHFTFTEGEVPLAITRVDGRTWTARAAWRLDALQLATGDMVVYRAVAADGRPGATPSESDSYIIEITDPGAIAASGYSADDQFDKYALSQEMLVLKTEKLVAAMPSISADSLATASDALAAEQRSVRALFVFMMGGEYAQDGDIVTEGGMTVVDEQEEADAESDLAAGRMANLGRVALVQGIRLMSQAATALTHVTVPQALTDERAALTSIQAAFSHSRYILRALTLRESLDPTRRLTGVLSSVFRNVGPGIQPAADDRITALRAALSGIASVAGASDLDRDASNRLAALAERVLRVDPSAPALQQVASRLSAAAAAIGRAQPDSARHMLDSAAVDLAAAVRGALPGAAADLAPPDMDRLDGALTDALRHHVGAGAGGGPP